MNKFELIRAMVESKPKVTPFPTLAEALKLSNQITQDHNAKAFEQVAIYRHNCPVSRNASEFNVMMVIWEAYDNGKQIFERHDYSR